MAAEGLDLDWYCYRHRTEDEVLPWDHLSAGLHKDFLWQDWRDALEEVGLEDCRWTPCYDCGACTGYGIEHVVASAVPPAGGSQGTGQDLRARRRGARHAVGPQAGGGGRMRQRVRFAKHGKVRFLSHRDVARVWERALRRAGIRVAYSEGFSPRPAPQLRPGAVHRLREPGRVPRHRPGRRPRTRGARRAGQPVAAHGHGGAGRHPHPAGHRLAPAGGHQLVVGDRASPASTPTALEQAVRRR